MSDPRSTRLWAARGVALSELGRDNEAIGSFEKSLSISPRFVAALEGASEVAYRSKDKRTGEYLNRLLQVEPGNSVAHAMMAAIDFENRDCRRAVGHFEKAASLVKQINKEAAIPLPFARHLHGQEYSLKLRLATKQLTRLFSGGEGGIRFPYWMY